jgi:histidinol dehydrogenase
VKVEVTGARLHRPAPPPSVPLEVAEILDGVRTRGIDAVLEFTRRFDGAALDEDRLRVAPEESAAALATIEPAVRDALEVAIANVEAVAQAQLREVVRVELPQGQQVEVAELPVKRAAVYAPAGRAPYPSSLVMGAVTARAAEVTEVVACAPPDRNGESDQVMLAACALCGVKEVWRIGGAQAIGALALGAGPIAAVDVIVGPGNAYVQEAKRQVSWVNVGIDGFAGPSELLVIADGDDVDPAAVALDLLAQAEHGSDSLLWLVTCDERLQRAVLQEIERLAADRPTVTDARLEATTAPLDGALAMAEDMAPEHLELVGARAEGLAGKVRRAGCLFVGGQAATAFGDYVAGSNHVLPTGGAARFQSALSVATFRRRMARVFLPGDAAARLAGPGAALARAEGFPVHAESMERRA